MLLLPHTELALARLRRLPSAWLAAAGFACLGPLLSLFKSNAPIADGAELNALPWLFLAALVGALLGIGMIRNTQCPRRAAQSPIPGDFILIATPTLALALISLVSMEASGIHPPWTLGVVGAVQVASLATLLYPVGALAVLAVTWVLPPLLPLLNLSPITPLRSAETPIVATLAFSLAFLLLSTVRPNALRSPR